MKTFPQRIMCLTEESVELLYLLGKEDLIVGTSHYVKRPEGLKKHPKVCAFKNGNVKKIVELKPDLVLGFSDIQKDLARDLIAEGLNVFIANQRSLEEVLQYIDLVGRMVGENEKTQKLIQQFKNVMEEARKKSSQFQQKPRVYFEEWDEPMISGICWVSDIIELCGGIDIFRHKAKEQSATDRIVQSDEIIKSNPHFIFGCWCGKKVNIPSIGERDGWGKIAAVKEKNVFELPPEIFLQPGPALFLEAIPQMQKLFLPKK